MFLSKGDVFNHFDVRPSVRSFVRPEHLSGLFRSNYWLAFIDTSLEASLLWGAVHICNMFAFRDTEYVPWLPCQLHLFLNYFSATTQLIEFHMKYRSYKHILLLYVICNLSTDPCISFGMKVTFFSNVSFSCIGGFMNCIVQLLSTPS